MMTFLNLVIAILAGVAAGLYARRWIEHCYDSYTPQSGVLSYSRDHLSFLRERLMPAVLAGLFCWTLLRWQGSLLAMLFTCVAEFFLVLCTITDLEQEAIFDRVLAPFAVIGFVGCLLLDWSLLNHLIAAGGALVVFLALSLLTRGAIGGGDIKLMGTLGLWLGTSGTTDVGIYGLIIGGLLAALLMATKRRGLHDTFAYGPCFTIVALLMLLP